MTELLNRYRLETPLGEGGMARVWRALDTNLRRPVAVKVLKLGLDPAERERFLVEARALTRLRSRHILEVLDFGEADGSFFFVMPFVRAVCLADLLAIRKSSRRWFTPGEAAAIAYQVARALEEAHAQDLVHRDVKPHNILVTATGATYLTDFGIVRDLGAESDLTQAGTVLGTPRYMAPEQLMGLAVDRSTDLYALGLLIHEMIAGQIPGEVPGDLAATLRRRIVGQREPIRFDSPDARPLAAVLEGLLAPREQRGSGSAAALAETLGPLAARKAALEALRADVQAILEQRGSAPVSSEATSPWTLIGQQTLEATDPAADAPPGDSGSDETDPVPSSAQAPPAGPGNPAPPAPSDPGDGVPATDRAARRSTATPLPRGEVLPLARPTRPEPARPPVSEARSPWPVTALVVAAFLAALVGAATLLDRGAPTPPSITHLRVSVGFQRVRVEWAGEARELSLVTPRGHEEIYGVRDRQDWESSRLVEPGTYSVSLHPLEGSAFGGSPFEFKPFDAAAVPIRVERTLDALTMALELPVQARAELRLESENLSVVQAVSPQARQHRVRLPLDPMEASTLKVSLTSVLGEELPVRPRRLPPLAVAFQQAQTAAAERLVNLPWKSWSRRLQETRSQGSGAAEALRRDIAALGLDAPFRELLPAVPAYLDSAATPLDAKLRLYESLMRLQDPDYFCEKHGVESRSPLAAALPPAWAPALETTLPGAVVLPLPLAGIMTFKPRFTGKLASYDFMDEISRVEEKETVLDLPSPVHRAELMLETWALVPDQHFAVTINQRATLLFRVRGRVARIALGAHRTVPIFHTVDPSLLVRGPNRFRIAILSVPAAEPIEVAALNSAVLRVLWDGRMPSGHSTAGAGAANVPAEAEQPVQPPPVPGSAPGSGERSRPQP